MVTLTDCPPHTFPWDEGSVWLLPPPLCKWWVFPSLFLLCLPPSPTAPDCTQCPEPGTVPGIQDLRMGMGPGAQQPISPPRPCPTHIHSSSRSPALGPGHTEDGWAGSGLGLCLEPKGSLLLPPPCPARARPVCCLPTVPLCPQGRRRRKAHHARGRAPALTLSLPAPPATCGCFSLQGRASPCRYSGECGCNPVLGASPLTSPTRTWPPAFWLSCFLQKTKP